MIKRTAVIDIGSNSARLVIFEQTSLYGFHLICEKKSKVRIGEDAYEKKGYLQPIGIRRAFLALKSFLHTMGKYQVNQTICVATSALRDAPNKKDFVSWIKNELGLSIEIIDGKKEAKYGAIAANNLLPIDEGLTVDIGGGSSDIALILNGLIVDTYSLNLGTVRLKELFFDKQANLEIVKKAKAYIQNELSRLPKHFQHKTILGIGGTARTLSKSIMRQSNYPLKKLHGFSYNIKEYIDYLKTITLASPKDLNQFNFKKNRYDTIREGTLIFTEILSHVGAKTVISSGVGVREGVFLEQLLRKNELRFPTTINPSIHSILDRFKPLTNIDKKQDKKLKLASNLYTVLQQVINNNKQYEQELFWALKLSNIGKTLTIYRSHEHAFYIAMQELNYKFTHKQIILISLLLRINTKDPLNKALFEKYHSLLPSKETMLWLSFIYTLTVLLYESSTNANIKFTYSNETLYIEADKTLYLAKEKIKALKKPLSFIISIKDEDQLPRNKILGI